MKNNATKNLTRIALMSALIAVCSWISIPTPVPFTLQTFAVFLALEVLGGKNGTTTIALYILLGAVGLPVFSGFTGGLGKLFGATGGYILGFLISGLLYWLVERLLGNRLPYRIASVVFGLLLCYAFGTIWFQHLYSAANGPVSIGTVLGWCVIPFLIPDAIKIALAFTVGKSLQKALQTSFEN